MRYKLYLRYKKNLKKPKVLETESRVVFTRAYGVGKMGRYCLKDTHF